MIRRARSFALCLLFSGSCLPDIAATRVDDPDNPPDTAIEGSVEILDVGEDTFFHGGRYFTHDPILTLRVTFTGAAARATVSVNGMPVGEPSPETERGVELDPDVPFHVILVTFLDLADHQGGTARLEVIFDADPPEVTDTIIVTDDRPIDPETGNIYDACMDSPPTASEPVVDVRILADDDSPLAIQLKGLCPVGGTCATEPTACDQQAFSDDDPKMTFIYDHRVLMSNEQGEQIICAKLIDAAGNETPPFVVGSVIFDSRAPTSPRITTSGAVVDASEYELTFTQSTDTLGNFAGYEIFGGDGEAGGTGAYDGSSEFARCETCYLTGSTDQACQGADIDTANCWVNFALEESQQAGTTRVQNILRIRAIDCAGNVSDDDFRVIIEDSKIPDAPADVRALEENGAVVVSWAPPSMDDQDVTNYRIYYGTVSRDFSGTFAANGPSPINVGRVRSFRLTGLPNGTTVYASVTAMDDTELIEVADGAATCSSNDRTPEEIGGIFYCREAHESEYSEEIAVLSNLVTPETLPIDMLSASWHRLSISPNTDRLLVSCGSAVFPFLLDIDANNEVELRLGDGQNFNSPYLGPPDPRINLGPEGAPIQSAGFTDDAAFASNGVDEYAYVANGNMGVMILRLPVGGPGGLAGNLGNPASFSREVEIIRDPAGDDMLVVGGDRGLQLFRLVDGTTGSSTSYTSPQFVKTVFSNKAVRSMVWDPSAELLFVSLFVDGIAIMNHNLDLVSLGASENPFCPEEFGENDQPECNVVDLERALFPSIDLTSGASPPPDREVLILADQDHGIGIIDLGGFLATRDTGAVEPPHKIGFCTECFRLIELGTIAGIEVIPPFILVLGSKTAEVAPGTGLVGPDVADVFKARGSVIEALFAINNDTLHGDLHMPESLANPNILGAGWITLAAGTDMAVIENSVVIAQRNLGLKAFALDDFHGSTATEYESAPVPDLSIDTDLTPDPSATGTCLRPVRVVGNARKLAITGSRMVVADGEAGAHVLSLQNPARPIHEVELPMIGDCTVGPNELGETFDVAVTGPFAFAATAPLGLRVFDLRPLVGLGHVYGNPTKPGTIQQLAQARGGTQDDLDGFIHDDGLPGGINPPIDPFPSNFVVRVAARRDMLWMIGLDTNDLCMANEAACLSNGPLQVGEPGLESVHLKLFAWDLTKLYDTGDFLVGNEGSQAPDVWRSTEDLMGVLDFGRPDVLDRAITAGEARALDLDKLLSNLEVGGAFLYLGMREPGFPGMVRIRADPQAWPAPNDGGYYDIANPVEYTNAAPRQIRTRGKYVYIADENRGLVIMEEMTGELLTTLNPNGQAKSLTVEGNLIYLGTSAGLQIIALRTDVVENVELRTVGFLKTPAPVLDVVVHGALAYLATEEAGLRVVELADVQSPEPFLVAPFAENDGAFTGSFSISGVVAYLINEGVDLFSRDDNSLLTIDLRSPAEPIKAVSTQRFSPGATHVAVDGESLYVSASAPPESSALGADPYEKLSGGPNNNNSTQAAPISSGRYEGGFIDGLADEDWFVIMDNGLTPGMIESFVIELMPMGPGGELQAHVVRDRDCDYGGAGPQINIAEESNSVSGGGAPASPAHFFGPNQPIQIDLEDDDPTGAFCVYIRVRSFLPSATPYILDINWGDLQECGDPAMPDVFDRSSPPNNDANNARAVAAGRAEYRLCAPGTSAADYFSVEVPANRALEVRAEVNPGGQQLSLAYDDATDFATPLQTDLGPREVHAVLIDNLASGAASVFYVRVEDANAGSVYEPYVLSVSLLEEQRGDVFDPDRPGVTPRLVAGWYGGLYLEPAGAWEEYTFKVPPPVAPRAQIICVSARGEDGPLDNTALSVEDNGSADVTADVVPSNAGDDCSADGGYALVQGGAIPSGTFTVRVTNNEEVSVWYSLEILVDGEGYLPDSAEENDTPSPTPLRLPAANAWIGPLYLNHADPDYFTIRVKRDQRIRILGNRSPGSENDFNMVLLEPVDPWGEIVFPVKNTQLADTIDFINTFDNDQEVCLRVTNDGGDTQPWDDFYSLEIMVSNAANFAARVDAFNAAPWELISVGESVPQAARGDALASWGPYTYHLVYNVGSTLFVTRFSDSVPSGGVAPIGAVDGPEGWSGPGVVQLDPPPIPPFKMVAEGPRIFIVETDNGSLWYVDVTSVIEGTGSAEVVGPWRLFTGEAPTVDGIALHGGRLFIANAARGAIYALDVGYITVDDTWLRARDEFSPIIEFVPSDELPFPVVGVSASTNVAGSLAMSGFRLAAGLVGITPYGPSSVGTALFDVSSVLRTPSYCAPSATHATVCADNPPMPPAGMPPDIFTPDGAATTGAFHLQMVGPYLYVSNENGFQVLDLR